VIQSVTANGELAAVKTVQVGCQVSGMIKELQVNRAAWFTLAPECFHDRQFCWGLLDESGWPP
jgi:hypothetical protein